MRTRYRTTLIGALVIWIVRSQVGYAQENMVISTGIKTNPIVLLTEPVIREAYRHMGIAVEISYFPWERSIRNANHGITSGELFRSTVDPEAYPNLVKVGVPIWYVEFVAFTKDTKIRISGWDSLKPYRIAFVLGVKTIEENTRGMIVEGVGTHEQAFMMLNTKRSDIVVDSRIAGLKYLNELSLADIRIIEPPVERIPVYHYLHLSHVNLLPELEKTLKEMEKDGVKAKIQGQVIKNILGSGKK